jgi:hypothetical protein
MVVHEFMTKFKGRSSLKEYMPQKQVKKGYKVLMMFDKAGYLSWVIQMCQLSDKIVKQNTVRPNTMYIFYVSTRQHCFVYM